MAHLIYSALSEPRRPIVYVSPKTTVSQCINLMIKENIGAVIVLERENLVGMVTERDIVRSCLSLDLDPHKTTAADVAYSKVSVLNLFDPVEKAMEIITETKRRHILIEENGKFVAILSIGDLLFHLLEDKIRVIEQLENYIHTY
ncbi:Hypoxic response protein 1 [Legionella nautarum]|uniref:Hypoxic response protein 1 n=1 Tax=Legionella nautarum TaxID=45070 RepID=A0A0W0WU62_9GAMM|nr:CBS domain-containing protein [Legionella nautarum]KTD35886.1 Hypoxic response protein 1 [Legionella nautarum]